MKSDQNQQKKTFRRSPESYHAEQAAQRINHKKNICEFIYLYAPKIKF